MAGPIASALGVDDWLANQDETMAGNDSDEGSLTGGPLPVFAPKGAQAVSAASKLPTWGKAALGIGLDYSSGSGPVGQGTREAGVGPDEAVDAVGTSVDAVSDTLDDISEMEAPDAPDVPGVDNLTVLVWAIVVGLALWLLRPALGLAENVTED